MSNWYKMLCTYYIYHSILASPNINMKLFLISALLFALVGVSKQAKDENGNLGIKKLTNNQIWVGDQYQ